MSDELRKMLNIESKPLKEALVPPEVEEYTKEELEVLKLGYDKSIVKGWYINNSKALTTKGVPRMDFFQWILDNSSVIDLGKITVNNITPKQQGMLDTRTEDLELEVNDMSLVKRYIDENAELLKINKELRDSVEDWKEIAQNAVNHANIGVMLVKIFADQEIETDVFNDEGIEIIKEMYRIDE